MLHPEAALVPWEQLPVHLHLYTGKDGEHRGEGV